MVSKFNRTPAISGRNVVAESGDVKSASRMKHGIQMNVDKGLLGSSGDLKRIRFSSKS